MAGWCFYGFVVGLLSLGDEEPVAEVALRVGEVVVGGLAAALAVEGELVEALHEGGLAQVMAHANGLYPRRILFHLVDSLARACGGGG